MIKSRSKPPRHESPAANDNLPTTTPPAPPTSRLVKGECIASMDAMSAGSIDLVVTSPPYLNIGMPYGDTFATIEDYIEFSRQWITAAARVLKPGGAMWINVGMHKAGPNSRVPLTYHLFPLIAGTGLTFVQEIVWDRRAQQNTNQRFATRSERWVYLVKPGVQKGGRGRPKNIAPTFNLDAVRRPSTSADKRNNPAGANPADIWDFTQVHGTSKERTAHPCPFPQAMIEQIVLACSNPGDVVLDPFGGSGTTGAAALAHGRSSVMIEREPTYWPIIEKRLGLQNDAVRLILGETLARIGEIADQSVDLIAADLPYGCTRAPWDEIIPMAALWAEYRRVLKPTGTIVLTSAGLFSAKLMMAASDLYKHSLVWEKTRATRFVHAKSQVLMEHEDVLIFSKGGIGNRAASPMTYNPQGLIELAEPRVSRNGGEGSVLYQTHPYRSDSERRQTHTNYPRSVLRFPSVTKPVHPTQKPVDLFDWIIRTYSNPGDVVLDNTMGSGTTGCAAVAAGRQFIGIERDPEFFQIAEQRIEAVKPGLSSDLVAAPTVGVRDAGLTSPANDEIAQEVRPLDVSGGAALAKSDCWMATDGANQSEQVAAVNDATPRHDVIRYATVCSGIEGVSLAWEPPGGFEPAFFSEIERFPSAVLKQHWPDVPNLENMLDIDGMDWRGKLDVLWGSTPCTAFSRTGNRQGMDDPRGALTRQFVDLADDIDPEFVILENVKGLLNDSQNAFGNYLGALVGAPDPLLCREKRWPNFGYVAGVRRHVAWRVLDAQHGGVAQHRERVFVVGCPRNGPDPREVLFEQSDEGGHHQAAAGTARHRQAVVAARVGDRRPAVYLNADTTPKWAVEQAYTLRAAGGSGGKACVVVDGRVRELTPLERERLMGIRDGHTNIPWPGKPRSLDVARFKAIGNSLSIPDVRWLGERIKLARALHQAELILPLAA